MTTSSSGSFPAYATWQNGCTSTVARLSSLVWPAVAPYGERGSIQEVFSHPTGAVWAPQGDLNNPAGYLNSVLVSMNRHSDQSATTIIATAPVTPPVYQDYITVNYTAGRAGHDPLAMVLHVTQGESAAGCIGWFKNPKSKVSSHYVLDRNGDIYATESVSIRQSAKVKGNIFAPRVGIADGANFSGSIDMNHKGAAVATRPATVQVTLSEPAAERLLTKAMG